MKRTATIVALVAIVAATTAIAAIKDNRIKVMYDAVSQCEFHTIGGLDHCLEQGCGHCMDILDDYEATQAEMITLCEMGIKTTGTNN